MKRSHNVYLAMIFAAVLISSFSNPALAQREAVPSDKIVQIRKIELNHKVATPEYQLVTGQYRSAGRTRHWFQVNVSYETTPEWIDDVTFTYYIVTQSKTGGKKPTMFRGEVTYVNVQKGKHESDMYLHPSTIARYGEAQRVGVVISSQGRVLAMESMPASNQRWWEQVTPQDGYVLNRMQTPFAMMNFDVYEAIKPSSAGR
jgi:hypothetical protein